MLTKRRARYRFVICPACDRRIAAWDDNGFFFLRPHKRAVGADAGWCHSSGGPFVLRLVSLPVVVGGIRE